LFALARLRLFRQRNGGFVALGAVCLVGVLVPLVEYAWTRGSKDAAGPYEETDARLDIPSAAADSKSVVKSLKEEFKLRTPPPDTFGFRVLQDLRVEIDGKKYVINEGDVFAVGELTGEDVRFTAGDEQIALPLNMVELIGSPTPEKTAGTADTPAMREPAAPEHVTPPAANPAAVASTPAKSGPVNITEEAQREAIRRYPAIGLKNSPANMLFIESYQELKHSGADDFFANPEWPLALAEMLAKREGWNQPGGKPAQANGATQGEPAGQQGTSVQQGLPEQSGSGETTEEPRRKRRPVAEELDEPEAGTPEASGARDEAPAKPMQDDPEAASPGAELPSQ
jgi:hypothetical protein